MTVGSLRNTEKFLSPQIHKLTFLTANTISHHQKRLNHQSFSFAMGKRKRSSSDHNKTKYASSSDEIPCSSGTELLSREKFSYLLDSSESRPLLPMVDTSDSTVKLSNVHHSHAHQNYNLGRSVVLKRSRHYYGHQYSRRNSGSHADASTSRGKTALSPDGRLTFKLSGQLGSEAGCLIENKEVEFSRPDRVRFSSVVMDAVSSDAVKMVCGICQKLVRRKPNFLGNALNAGEFSVAAILVCGHVYHSECLEQKTSIEDMRDPPCPLCSGLRSEEDASRGQK